MLPAADHARQLDFEQGPPGAMSSTISSIVVQADAERLAPPSTASPESISAERAGSGVDVLALSFGWRGGRLTARCRSRTSAAKIVRPFSMPRPPRQRECVRGAFSLQQL